MVQPSTSSLSLRPLVPSDAQAFRDLRLEALAGAPEAFGSSYEEEAVRSLDDFRAMIPEDGPGRIFGAWSDERLVGMAGFAVQSRLKAQHKGIMWGVYVQPDRRGQGLGEALVRQVVTHAAAHVIVLEAAVGLSNTGARRTYHKLGFRPYGIERKALRVGDTFYDEELLFMEFETPRARSFEGMSPPAVISGGEALGLEWRGKRRAALLPRGSRVFPRSVFVCAGRKHPTCMGEGRGEGWALSGEGATLTRCCAPTSPSRRGKRAALSPSFRGRAAEPGTHKHWRFRRKSCDSRYALPRTVSGYGFRAWSFGPSRNDGITPFTSPVWERSVRSTG